MVNEKVLRDAANARVKASTTLSDKLVAEPNVMPVQAVLNDRVEWRSQRSMQAVD